MTDQPIRLRGHHFLCLLTYVGRGYSPAFIVSMDRAAARIGAGAPIEIVTGPDDLCAPLQAENHQCGAHCLTGHTQNRDRLALECISALIGPVAVGETRALSRQNIADLRTAFAHHPGFRAACTGCEWHSLCDGVAANGFAGAKL